MRSPLPLRWRHTLLWALLCHRELGDNGPLLSFLSFPELRIDDLRSLRGHSFISQKQHLEFSFCECFMNEAETPLFRGREWTILCGHQTDTHCSPVNPALHCLEAASHFYLEVPCLMLSAFQHKHILSPFCSCVMSGFFLSPCDIYCWRSSEFPAPFMKDNAILSFCWSIPSLAK